MGDLPGKYIVLPAHVVKHMERLVHVQGVPNSGSGGIRGSLAVARGCCHAHSHRALVVLRNTSPYRLVMKSLSRFSMIHQPFRNRTSADPQSCIRRFSPAVFVGVPIGVSLPEIALIGHLGQKDERELESIIERENTRIG